MTYRTIKIIKGRGYLYEQRTWREGKRVRTESRYIGPVGGQPARRRFSQKIADFIAVNTVRGPDDFITEEMLAQYNARVEQQEQARLAKLDDLYAKYGLHLADDRPDLRAAPKASPMALPSDVPVAEQSAAPPSDAAAEESPSADEGQGNGENAADGAQNS